MLQCNVRTVVLQQLYATPWPPFQTDRRHVLSLEDKPANNTDIEKGFIPHSGWSSLSQ